MARSMWEYEIDMRASFALNETNRKRITQLIDEYNRAIDAPGAYKHATREQLDVYRVAAQMSGMLKALNAV